MTDSRHFIAVDLGAQSGRVVLGTFTPDMCIPSTACIVQEALDLDAPAMDVTAACAGFAYALVTAAQFLAAGTSRLALVVGADTNSRVVDPADIKTWPLFGDGAGAVLLEATGSPDQGLLATALGSDGRGAGLSHFALHGQGPFEATLEPDGPFDWFAGYDPVTDEISVFVEGAPGEVELRLTP